MTQKWHQNATKIALKLQENVIVKLDWIIDCNVNLCGASMKMLSARFGRRLTGHSLMKAARFIGRLISTRRGKKEFRKWREIAAAINPSVGGSSRATRGQREIYRLHNVHQKVTAAISDVLLVPSAALPQVCSCSNNSNNNYNNHCKIVFVQLGRFALLCRKLSLQHWDIYQKKFNFPQLIVLNNQNHLIPNWHQNDTKMTLKWHKNDIKVTPKLHQNYI